MTPRERQLVGIAGGAVAAALVWMIAISPALQTYRSSSAVHAKLDAELVQMQALAQEAKRLKALPTVSAAAAQTWLETSVKKLGKATVTVQGGRAQVSFTGATPEALAAWLTDARTAAQLLPNQANWKRSAPIKNMDPKSPDVLWDGTTLLELPSK